MSFIIYPQADNKLAVIIPTGDVADCVKDVPVGAPYAIVDHLAGIDNDYFDGFVYADGQIEADISKCKSIHLDKFRFARKPKLESLDVQYMKALELGDSEKANEIAVQKQELRDITKITLPDTLPEIKATWPDILK